MVRSATMSLELLGVSVTRRSKLLSSLAESWKPSSDLRPVVNPDGINRKVKSLILGTNKHLSVFEVSDECKDCPQLTLEYSVTHHQWKFFMSKESYLCHWIMNRVYSAPCIQSRLKKCNQCFPLRHLIQLNSNNIKQVLCNTIYTELSVIVNGTCIRRHSYSMLNSFSLICAIILMLIIYFCS